MNNSPQHDFDRSNLIEILQIRIDKLHDNKKLALLILEISNLRTIEAYHGHELSLAMNAHVSQIINTILRTNDFVYKMNDRRFAIILDPIINTDHSTLAIEKLLKLFSSETIANVNTLRTNIRIGLAITPDHSNKADKLLNYAEFALEKANALKTHYHLYDNQLAQKLMHEALLEDDLLNSIKNDELQAVYQPQVCLKTANIIGIEALIRWNSKKHGSVSPDIFIPIAENNHYIKALSEWMFKTVLRQCQPLANENSKFTVSINASAPLFEDLYFVEFIERATSLWGFPSKQLVIEITESIMMHHPDRISDTLVQLRQLGVKLAIDDFGTGFSSLSYLKKMPIQEIKIDKSFLIGLSEKDDNWKIVQSVVDLARRFELETVAEGIECESTYELVKSLGVDRAQGYLISKPVDFKTLLQVISTYNSKLNIQAR